MNNNTILTLEIFQASKLFWRTPDVVESLDYEHFRFFEFIGYSQSPLAFIPDHLCHRYPLARSVSGKKAMISRIQTKNTSLDPIFW